MNSPVFRKLIFSKIIRRTMEDLFERAKSLGFGTLYLNSLAFIEDRLLNAPLPPSEDASVFGEPAYRLPHLKLLVCHAIATPIAVNFAVSLEIEEQEGKSILHIYLMSLHLIEPPKAD